MTYEIKDYSNRITAQEHAEVERILNQISTNDPKPTVNEFLSLVEWALDKHLLNKKE